MACFVHAPNNLEQVSTEYIIMQLPPDLENECNGQIVATSEDAQTYYITGDHVYKLFARDSSNTRFLLPSPDGELETPQLHTALCTFGSVVELDPSPPVLDSILRRCIPQQLGGNIVAPIYLSRLLSESNYVATKKDVCTYLASLAMFPCDTNANPKCDPFTATGEYPLARFHTNKVAEVLALFLRAEPTSLERDSLPWCAPSTPLSTLVETIQRILPETSWGLAIHAIVSLSKTINGHTLSLDKLAEFVSEPTSLNLNAQTTVSLSPRRIIASIVLSFINQSGTHISVSGVHTVKFALKTVYSKLAEMSFPREFLMAYMEEAELSNQLEQVSLPVIAYIDLLVPRSLRDPKSTDTSSCWISPEDSLLIESQLIYIERSHLSSNPLNRAFELLDIQPRWRKSAFAAFMVDTCAPQEDSNAVTECYTREVGRTDCGEMIVVEKREKRILLASRVQNSQW